MKVRAYMRVAKHPHGRKGYKLETTSTPSNFPLVDGSGSALPTVAFALDIVIPDSAFKQAEQVIAEITIPEDALQIAAEVNVKEAPNAQ